MISQPQIGHTVIYIQTQTQGAASNWHEAAVRCFILGEQQPAKRLVNWPMVTLQGYQVLTINLPSQVLPEL